MTSTTSTAKPAMSLQALGISLALLGAALFATKGIIIKLALADGIDTLTTLAWRQVVAVPVFVTVGVLGYVRKRRDAPAGAAPVLDRRTMFQALGVGCKAGEELALGRFLQDSGRSDDAARAFRRALDVMEGVQQRLRDDRLRRAEAVVEALHQGDPSSCRFPCAPGAWRPGS